MPGRPTTPQKKRDVVVSGPLRLLALSALMLFTELALIRWLGSEVVYLSYFSNFVLLGSFLGIGIGFIKARSHERWFRATPVALLVLVGIVMGFPSKVESGGTGLIYVGGTPSGLPSYVILPLIFALSAVIMGLIASEVAASFATFDPLTAYRLDISGSVIGIAAFSGLAFLNAGPVAWGAIVSVSILILLLPRVRPTAIVGAIGVVAILAVETASPSLSWSPYYKIEVRQYPAAVPVYGVAVNGVPYQAIEPLSVVHANSAANIWPYVHVTSRPRDVLIIGSGNGKDVALALENGAQHVDAVEIDPRIRAFGVQLNTDHPYDDPRVETHITDGRAFLEQTTNHYDLIVFAATDSITLVLGQSSLRLESYLFTEDAMRTAHSHLKPGGVFAAFNYYWQPWYLDRLAGTLKSVYGRAPCLDSRSQVGTLAVLTVSDTASSVHCDSTWTPATNPVPASVSDDYPFPYLQTPSIPAMTLVSLLLILVVAGIAVRLAAGRLRTIAGYTDLFAMGAAFLLLETKSVVQFALLFGTTWVVNALVFGGILLSILAAIEVSRRFQVTRIGLVYALLLVAVAIAWVVPFHDFLGLAFVPRLIAATVFSFAPVFLANLLFAQRFRSTSDSTTAFAANLLGAIVGGVLEYSALLVGYRALLILVAILYAIAFLTGRSSLTAA